MEVLLLLLLAQHPTRHEVLWRCCMDAGDCREVLTEALGQFRELTRLSIANLDIHNRDGRIKSPCMSTG